MDAAAVAPAPWRRGEKRARERGKAMVSRHGEYLYKLRSARHIVNREPRGQFNASRTPPPPYRVRVLWTRETSGPSRVLRASGGFIVALNIYLTPRRYVGEITAHVAPVPNNRNVADRFRRLSSSSSIGRKDSSLTFPRKRRYCRQQRDRT